MKKKDTIYCPICKKHHKFWCAYKGLLIDFTKDILVKQSKEKKKCLIDLV